MKDVNGIELKVGQTVKERARRGKTKIVSLDDPFIYVRRADAFDDAPVFPEDLTVIETHEVLVVVAMKCDTEDTAIAQITKWATENEKTLPAGSVSYHIKVK